MYPYTRSTWSQTLTVVQHTIFDVQASKRLFYTYNIMVLFNIIIITVLSRKYAPPPRDNAPPPPPPPFNSFDENYCAGTISLQTLTVTNNLCDVYKILYYAAVYVRGHFC